MGGKKIGDTLLQENPAGRSRNYKIKEIWAVEGFAIWQSITLLTTRFAGQTVFESKMPKGKSPQEGLKLVFKKSRLTRAIMHEDLSAAYRKLKMSLNMLSITMENNIVAAYFNVMSAPEQFMVTHAFNEHEMLHHVLSEKQYVIIDATTLLTQWVIFGNADYLEAIPAKYIIGQATLDECKYYLKHIRNYSQTAHPEHKKLKKLVDACDAYERAEIANSDEMNLFIEKLYREVENNIPAQRSELAKPSGQKSYDLKKRISSFSLF